MFEKDSREQYKFIGFEMGLSYQRLLSKINTKPYYTSKDTNYTLFKADSIGLMGSTPSKSIDMIFADPPYFLSNGGFTCHAGKMVSVNKGAWDKSKGIEETHKFNLEWLEKCQNILTENGTIWVSGTSHVIFSVGFAMQQLGFKILNDIAWDKVNPPPNLSCRYFTHSTETVIWAAKNKKSKHYFNYNLMKSMNNNKQMKSIWPIMAPRREEKVFGKHPTQKPMELLERIVLASTRKDDIVLDPFSGSGTTGLAAYKYGRKYIGIELEQEYLQRSVDRFKALEKITSALAELKLSKCSR